MREINTGAAPRLRAADGRHIDCPLSGAASAS